MKRNAMVMDWKNQYSKNVNSPLIHQFNEIPIKISVMLFVDHIILKFTWKGKGTRIAKLEILLWECHYRGDEKIRYRPGENICKPPI